MYARNVKPSDKVKAGREKKSEFLKLCRKIRLEISN